ncbi:MAG: glycosyltransferase [Thermoplasmata archaeon]|nr:glycosyltransferase [Thermoplasmata archaeon]
MTTFGITIPTLNSASTLRATLASVRDQRPAASQVVIVDGGSRDPTREIARQFDTLVLECPAGLLSARLVGIRAMRTEFTLLLDSDQVLQPDLLARCAETSDGYDIGFLLEKGRTPSTAVSRLYQARREVVQSNVATYGDPRSGLVLPRLFRTRLLQAAIERIRPELAEVVSDRDHQIIAYEVGRGRPRSFVVPEAIEHADPSTVRGLVSKSWRWGFGTGVLSGFPDYRMLLRGRFAPAVAATGPTSEPLSMRVRFAANLLGLAKAVPYEIGVLEGRLQFRRRLEGARSVARRGP